MLISFEGTDASRTSSQVSKIIENIEASGNSVTVIRTFSQTPVGNIIREILKKDRFIRFQYEMPTRYSEFLLLLCDYALRVETIIIPALDQGDIVICDRLIDSPIAFQAQMLRQQYPNMDFNQLVDSWSEFIQKTFPRIPDITILFDISEEECFRRVYSRDNVLMTENEKMVISDSIKAFRRLAGKYPHRFFIVDAELPPDEIINQVTSEIFSKMSKENL